MRTKEFIGTCVENPFGNIGALCRITDGGRRVGKKAFFSRCFVHPDIKRQMREYPGDYNFYKYRDVYFYKWSAIEHFYA